MKNPKICISDWKGFIGGYRMFEDQAMTWTVHRLKSESLILMMMDVLIMMMNILMFISFDHEKIFLIVLVMTRYFPKINMIHVRSDYLLIPMLNEFVPH
jgi:hypothetical protein